MVDSARRFLITLICIGGLSRWSVADCQSDTLTGKLVIEAGPRTHTPSFVIIRLLDVTIADNPAKEVARLRITGENVSAASFHLPYNRSAIDPLNTYIVTAEVFQKLARQRCVRTHISKQSVPVLTRGSSKRIFLRAEPIQ